MIRNTNKNTGDYKKRIYHYRLTIFYRLMAMIVIVTAVGIFLYFQGKNKVYENYIVEAEADRDGISVSTTVEFDGKILTYSNDGANCANKAGVVLWNQTYEMQDPFVSIFGSHVAIADKNGTSIYIMDSEKIIGDIDTKLPISNLSVSDNGLVAVVLDDSQVNWIYLFDSEGNVIIESQVGMKDSGYPLDIAISQDGVLLGVSYFQIDEGGFLTRMVFYNQSGVGANHTDRLVAGFNYKNAMIPVIEFMNDKNSFAVADNQLMIYEDGQEPKSVVNILLNEEIKGVHFNEKYIGLVFPGSKAEEIYRIDIYNILGELVLSQSLPLEYKDIVFGDEELIVYNDKECFIYNMKGLCKFNSKFDENIVRIIPSDKKAQYLYVTQDKIKTIRLQ